MARRTFKEWVSKSTLKESKCKCDCGKVPCVECGGDHHKDELKEDKKNKEDCGKGKYWCMTDKKCKKIPKGWHMMRSGLIMKDKEHEEEEEGKKNGNGNGEGSESNGGGVSESSCGSTSKKRRKKLSEMISTSMSGRKYRNIDNPEDQKRIRKERDKKKQEKEEYSKKRKAELADLRVTKGIRFYDKKGSGYIKDGKKVYDESVNLDEKCWKGYEKKGMKTMFGKRYPNCVKKEEYSDWRSELEEVHMFVSSKKNKETPKKKETWYERDERKAKEKKLRKESTEVQEGNKSGDSSLRDWFTKSRSSDGTPGWVQLGGKYAGKPCAKQPGQTTKPKCGSSKMKAELSDKEEERAFRRKNQEDPNPDRKGKAKNVATEEFEIEEGMSLKDFKKKRSAQKQKDKRAAEKTSSTRRAGIHNPEKSPERAARHRANVDPDFEGDDERNYPGGKLNPKKVRKAKALGELGESAGEKDACYSKVKSRYKVWPSAYASGALVKCRKVGAKNWGNKTKKEGYEFSNWRDEFKATEYETVDIIETTPLKETEEIRYCPKCKKNEKKRECKYGEKYWKMFSLPASLGGGGPYDPNEVHPANEGLSFDIGSGHKKAQKMGKIRNLSKGATGGEKDAAQAALKRLGGGISLPLADAVIYPGQLKTEDYQKLQKTGNVFSIMLMWRGKTYRLQLFFSGPKRPSREEVKAEIQKFYPGGILTHYYPSPSDPTQPIVVIQR